MGAEPTAQPSRRTISRRTLLRYGGAAGPRQRRGSGLEVVPTDPAAFLGRFAPARSTGVVSGSEVGFSFTGRGDSDRGYAQLGPERNGLFLRQDRRHQRGPS